MESHKHTVLCTVCSRGMDVEQAESVKTVLQEHRRDHVIKEHVRVHSVTLIFDPNDETDPIFAALLKWKFELQQEGQQEHLPEPT